MQTELIDVAMKAIAAHVAAPYKLRIAELEQQVQSGFTPEALAQEDRAERAEDELEMMRIKLKNETDRANNGMIPYQTRINDLEKKLDQARKIQGGMQKKNDALIAQVNELVAHGPTGALEEELRKHLAAANAEIKRLEQENRNLRGELSGKRFAAKSSLHKAVVDSQHVEPDTRPQPPKTGVGHGGLVLNMNDAREWDHR
ncbi:hypothetical protein [Enterobacter phage ST22]|nr:hypothetical protein [Enterobacter phage ST22]